MEDKQSKALFGRLKVLYKSVVVKDGVINVKGLTIPAGGEICRRSKDTMTIGDATGIIFSILEDHLTSLLGDISEVRDWTSPILVDTHR